MQPENQSDLPVAGLREAVLAALEAAGKDLRRLTPDDLAPLDEAHIRGRQATLELAERLRLDGTEEILDAGCGLGGAARFLALTCGCRVVGIEKNQGYVEAARMLSDLLGLGERVHFHRGDMLAIPFKDGRFDVVWTQHASMNIADKPALYQEFGRVLKPGGRLAMFDVLAGAHMPAIFPVPWAQTPRDSHLIRPEALRALLERLGYQIMDWRDTSAAGLAFFQKLTARIQHKGLPPLGPQVLFGAGFGRMAENVVRNLEEGRIVVVEAIWRKTGRTR